MVFTSLGKACAIQRNDVRLESLSEDQYSSTTAFTVLDDNFVAMDSAIFFLGNGFASSRSAVL
jgi:hypothetical protein